MPRERVTVPPQVSRRRREGRLAGRGDTPRANLDINPMSREKFPFRDGEVTS
jgi:hypothetical protein